MRFYTLLFILLCLTVSSKAKTEQHEIILRNYEGVMGKNLKVFFYLRFEGNDVQGNYFYTKIGTAILVSGKIKGDSIFLQENSAEFKGKISVNQDSISGEWKNEIGKKAVLPFVLKKKFECTYIERRYEKLYYYKKRIVQTLAWNDISFNNAEKSRTLQCADSLLKYYANGRRFQASVDEPDSTSVTGEDWQMYEDSFMPASWSESTTYIDYMDNAIISISHDEEKYTGGAYPNYSVLTLSSHYLYAGSQNLSDTASFEKPDLSKVWLSDILSDSSGKYLAEVAEKCFSQDNYISQRPRESYFSGGPVVLNDNYYFTPTGIKFQYNFYETGQPLNGSPTFFIPYRVIRKIIRPKSFVNKYFK